MGKYFKTVYTVVVLSEDEALGPVDLAVIDRAISDGPCIGQTEETSVEELSADEMRDALIEVGNDGSFFPSINEEDDESEVPTREVGPDIEDDDEDEDFDFDSDEDEIIDDDGDEDITEDA